LLVVGSDSPDGLLMCKGTVYHTRNNMEDSKQQSPMGDTAYGIVILRCGAVNLTSRLITAKDAVWVYFWNLNHFSFKN